MNSKFVKYYTFLLLLTFVSAASAYSLQFADENKTVRLRWKHNVIPIALSTSLSKQIQGLKSDSDVIAITRKSLANWERIANIKFEVTIVDKQSIGTAGKTGDGVNLVTIAQTPENLLLFDNDSEEISARTQTFFNGRGFITEADIVLNPYQQFSIDGTIGTFDFESALTHEIGHLLGLEHSLIPGATMFAHQGKNGTYGMANFAPRSLAEDDAAGIRALYGAKKIITDCCGTINGKIVTADGKTAKDFQIWVEESDNARIAAGVLTNADGSFQIEGLKTGKYSVYAQEYASGGTAAIGQLLGVIQLTKGKPVNFSKKMKGFTKTFDIAVTGFNGQLSDLAVPLNGGKSFLIYVGGKNLDIDKLNIDFNSPNFSVISNSLTKQDFGSEISVISFEVKVSSQTLSGEYSFFLRAQNGETAYVAGGLTVESFINPWSASVFSGSN